MLKKIKFISIGLIIGILISNFSVFANEINQFILTKVTYPIIVDNQEYTNQELPILNYKGNTYVPLRAVGDMLDSKVEWNSELNRVEIGDCTSPQDSEILEDTIVFESFNRYKILINIDNKTYDFMPKQNLGYDIYYDSNNYYMKRGILHYLVGAVNKSFKVYSTDNQFVDGEIYPDGSEYENYKEIFTSINDFYKENRFEYGNKYYYVSNKPDEEVGLISINGSEKDYVSLTELFNAFEINVDIYFDKEEKILNIKIN